MMGYIPLCTLDFGSKFYQGTFKILRFVNNDSQRVIHVNQRKSWTLIHDNNIAFKHSIPD